MVTRYTRDAIPYQEPPYSKQELLQIDMEGGYATPIAIIRPNSQTSPAPRRARAVPGA